MESTMVSSYYEFKHHTKASRMVHEPESTRLLDLNENSFTFNV